MRALPLFHRIAGKPVIVLGSGEAAEAKRRLVERAGGLPVADLAEGVAAGARLAFVAYDEPRGCEADAGSLRAAGLLVNVVDRPEMCDFTVPSVLDRDPVLVAVATAGASAGLAKQLRLRLEQVLPADLGGLAEALHSARARLRALWPDAAERRRALDHALQANGPLDPLAGEGAARLEEWLAGPQATRGGEVVELVIAGDDPDDLTLRQARLLGSADALAAEPGISEAVLGRARADAVRLPWPPPAEMPAGLVLVLRLREGAGDYNHLT